MGCSCSKADEQRPVPGGGVEPGVGARALAAPNPQGPAPRRPSSSSAEDGFATPVSYRSLASAYFDCGDGAPEGRGAGSDAASSGSSDAACEDLPPGPSCGGGGERGALPAPMAPAPAPRGGRAGGADKSASGAAECNGAADEAGPSEACRRLVARLAAEASAAGESVPGHVMRRYQQVGSPRRLRLGGLRKRATNVFVAPALHHVAWWGQA
jgi:hypothetical protein